LYYRLLTAISRFLQANGETIMITESNAAEALAGLIDGTAQVEGRAVLVSKSFRLPLDVVLHVESMAQAAGKSQAFILAELVRLGVQQVQAHLSEEGERRIQSAMTGSWETYGKAANGADGEEV
jgi:predicted DNA-binding protein